MTGSDIVRDISVPASTRGWSSILWAAVACGHVTVICASCDDHLCHPVGYWGNDLRPILGLYCYDVMTDGSDSLLAANTTAHQPRMPGSQMGGTITAHPSIQVWNRPWSVCAKNCPQTGVIEVTIQGNAGQWYGPNAAAYCKMGL